MGDMADDWRRHEENEQTRVSGSTFDGVTRFTSGRQSVIRGRSLTPSDAAEILGSLDNEIRRVVKRYGITDRFPAQPPVGSVLRWERVFPGRGSSGNVYTYVALRAGDKWYVTGRSSNIMSWDELADKIGDSPCFLVTGYMEIPRPKVDPLDSMTDPALWYQTVFGDGPVNDQKTEATAGTES